MGHTDDDDNGELGMAIEVLVKHDHLSKCPIHGELTDQLTLAAAPEDDDDSPAMVREMHELGFEGTMVDAWNVFLRAKSEAGDGCGSCGKNADS